jgi:hypothetical protein
MKHLYNNFSKIINLYSPTHNSIVFHALYSESESDKYIPSKLQSTLSSVTTTITDFARRRTPPSTAPGRSVPEASFDYYLKVRVAWNREFQALPDILC